MRDFTGTSNIKSIEFLDEEIEMMDLEVEEVHCLFVEGVLVHNCAEEMRLAANFSNEPNLLNPILSGEDIHKYVGIKMFGHYDKAHRTVAKVINFSALYGATGYTIARKLGVEPEVGEAYLDKYNKTMSNLDRWKKELIKEGKRKGIVYTFFGRPRAVWMYYQSSKASDHSFGDRTCVNSPIQGCLPGFAKVLTKSGYKRIADFNDGDYVWNGLVWTRAELKLKGKAHLVRVTTEDGYVFYCDDRHIVKAESHIATTFEWVKVQDLEGRKLCMNAKMPEGLSDGTIEEYSKGVMARASLKHKGQRLDKDLLRRGAKEYLRGLFEDSNELVSISPNFIVDLQDFLASCGIKSSIEEMDQGKSYKLTIQSSWFKPMINKQKYLDSTYNFSRVTKVEVLEDEQDMFTLATEHPLHQFVSDGVISKNTGGDVIRIDHIKYYNMVDPSSKTYDKEFAENTKYALTVHDEINIFTKPSHLRQAVEKLKNLMYLKFPQWKVPLVGAPSVGIDWGHQIDIKGFTQEGIIIPDCSEDLNLL